MASEIEKKNGWPWPAEACCAATMNESHLIVDGGGGGGQSTQRKTTQAWETYVSLPTIWRLTFLKSKPDFLSTNTNPLKK